MPEKVDQGILSSHDDGCTTITWRGDGAYVAVNSIEAVLAAPSECTQEKVRLTV